MPEALRQFKAEIFQALAHPTRIAILEALRDCELSAGDIVSRVGLEQANASQHLSVLRAKNIVVCRKAGSQMFYSVRDARIIGILDSMREYFHAHVEASMCVLREMSAEELSKTE